MLVPCCLHRVRVMVRCVEVQMALFGTYFLFLKNKYWERLDFYAFVSKFIKNFISRIAEVDSLEPDWLVRFCRSHSGWFHTSGDGACRTARTALLP